MLVPALPLVEMGLLSWAALSEAIEPKEWYTHDLAHSGVLPEGRNRSEKKEKW